MFEKTSDLVTPQLSLAERPSAAWSVSKMMLALKTTPPPQPSLRRHELRDIAAAIVTSIDIPITW